MRITVISDTHTKHGLIPLTDLPGGDLLIHAGDIMNSGYNKNDILDFCTWFHSLEQYDKKIFIAGNHDRMFENHPEGVEELLNIYFDIDYLQDEGYDLYDLDTDVVQRFMVHPGNRNSILGHLIYQKME